MEALRNFIQIQSTRNRILITFSLQCGEMCEGVCMSHVVSSTYLLPKNVSKEFSRIKKREKLPFFLITFLDLICLFAFSTLFCFISLSKSFAQKITSKTFRNCCFVLVFPTFGKKIISVLHSSYTVCTETNKHNINDRVSCVHCVRATCTVFFKLSLTLWGFLEWTL